MILMERTGDPRGKALFLAGVLLMVFVGSLFAFDPVYKLNGYGRIDGYSEEAEPYSLVGLEFTAGQRLILESGYWSWYAAGLLDYYLSGIDEIEDFEQVAADLRLNFGNFSLDTGGTFNFSAHTVDHGMLMQPEWSGSLLYTADSVPFFGSLDYSGTSVFQEGGTDDRVTNRAGLTLGYDHSLSFGLSGSIAAALTDYRESYILDETNGETDTLREDRRFEGELAAEGLIGFFSDWEVSLYLHYNDSNANRWLVSEVQLEKNSEDRRTTGLEYELNWSPHRKFQIGLVGFADFTEYLHRTVIDASGGSTGELLRVTRTGGTLNASWTEDGSLYWTIDVSAYRSFADDTDYDLWSCGLEAGLEFLF